MDPLTPNNNRLASITNLENKKKSNEKNKETRIVKDLYKQTINDSANNAKAAIITSDSTGSSYLVIAKKGVLGPKIKAAVKINLQSFQTDEPSYDSTDFVGEGSVKTAYRGQDIKNKNTMVVALFKDKSSHELGLEESIELSKQFKNEKYFAFGTWIQFDVKNPDGTTSPREAYLGPEKTLGNFLQYLEKNPRISEQKLAQVLLPAAKGLQKMHQKGVLHRDLKPENLLVDEAGAKIGDPDTLVKSNKGFNFNGTVLFMAPEIFQNLQPSEETGRVKVALSSKVSLKTDIFSWGAILYMAVTGRDLVDILKKKMTARESYDEWEDWDWREDQVSEKQTKTAKKIADDWHCDRKEKQSELQTICLAASHPVSFQDKLREFKKLNVEQKVEYLNKLPLHEQKKYLDEMCKNEKKELQQTKREVAKDNCKAFKAFIEITYSNIIKAHEYLQENYDSLKPQEAEAQLEFLAWRCVHPDPLKRPAMEEVVSSLKLIMNQKAYLY